MYNTWVVAFGSIALTNSDFAQLGTVLESADSSETEMVIGKAIINIGLNLHIFLGIPTALFWASEIDRIKINICLIMNSICRGPFVIWS